MSSPQTTLPPPLDACARDNLQAIEVVRKLFESAGEEVLLLRFAHRSICELTRQNSFLQNRFPKFQKPGWRNARKHSKSQARVVPSESRVNRKLCRPEARSGESPSTTREFPRT
jgi:hypothetical protein